MQIDTITSVPNNPNFSCTATLQTIPDITIDGLEEVDDISVTVNYYNALQETFREDAMIVCIGTLVVEEGDFTDPSLTIRSHCLIRFVDKYQIFLIYKH
jgi:hypothetical protein